MQPSPFSGSTSSSWISQNNSNLTTNNSNFWSNAACRKRKAAVSDLDEKANQKMFVTEEKMVKEMQTLSLDLANFNSNISNPTAQITEETIIQSSPTEKQDSSDDDENETNSQKTHFELHKLLKDSLKKDDLQDSLISKLCEIERRKLTMQIVPYMPIHPAQLNNDNVTTDDKIKGEEEEIIDNISPIVSEEVKNGYDEHFFKMPSVPTPYTVEEPCDHTIKRASAMKRSYSQSNQYNSNLTVTELKSDGNDPLSIHQSESPYFIVEPTTTPLCQTLSNTSSSSLSSSSGPSVRITEFVENPTLNNEYINAADDDDDIDMQSVASSDTGDKMDDD